MPEMVNTSFLGQSPYIDNDSDNSLETMVKVDNVSMVFNMASETMNNLKEYAIALARRELHFKEFRALDHISLEVKKGDVFGILGTNGSGKSTLLKIIAGVLEPSEGTCIVNGSIAPLIELGAGFDMELTARENIFLNGALLGYSKKFIEQHFDEIVEFAEIEKFLDMPLKNYSSGMVARIAFAIATVIVPEILIVDEVLSVGDFMFQQKCEHRINTLIKEHGVTVLIVSHSNDQIERLCNKAVWIEKGHMRMIGSASEVCQVYRTLGGHSGSSESEKQVYEVLNSSIEVSESACQAISGENRYSTSVNLFENTYPNLNPEAIIIASGESIPSALLGSNMSAITGYPILLSKKESLPDIISSTLRQYAFKKAILIGNDTYLSNKVASTVSEIIGKQPERINLTNHSDLANYIYKMYTKEKSKTAVLTYPTCTADLLSLAPYIAKKKAPIFFNVSNGNIADETIELLLSGEFEEIIVLGGQTSFPDEALRPFSKSNINLIRFCGKDPFDANRMITTWISDQIALDTSKAIIASPENPGEALVVTPFLTKQQHPVFLENPRNLDSVVNVFTQLKNNKTKSLILLGNETVFSKLDKELLSKVVSTNRN